MKVNAVLAQTQMIQGTVEKWNRFCLVFEVSPTQGRESQVVRCFRASCSASGQLRAENPARQTGIGEAILGPL
jgi:hypothetical protein